MQQVWVNLISEGTSISVVEHAPRKWEVLVLVYATCIVLFLIGPFCLHSFDAVYNAKTITCRDTQISQNCRSHLKILVARQLSWSKFCSENLQILGSAIHPLGDLALGICALLIFCPLSACFIPKLLNVQGIEWLQ